MHVESKIFHMKIWILGTWIQYWTYKILPDEKILLGNQYAVHFNSKWMLKHNIHKKTVLKLVERYEIKMKNPKYSEKNEFRDWLCDF